MFRIRCKKRAAGLVGIIFDRVTTFSSQLIIFRDLRREIGIIGNK